MNFQTPSTKEEMYQTLNDIFLSYRIMRPNFELPELDPLVIDYMPFTELTDEELTEKAENILSGEHKAKVIKCTEEIDEDIEKINAEISELNDEISEQTQKIEKEYDGLIIKLKKEASKKGIERSNIVFGKIAEYEKEKQREIENAISEKNKRLLDLNSLKTAKENQKDDILATYSEMFSAEIEAKFIELKDAQDKQLREVFKYNNSVDEKLLKYSNYLKQIRGNMQLRFLEIRSTEMKKDELIQYGYYTDVISCVTGYYYTLNPLVAYNDILTEERLIVYLEDYYSSVVSLLKARAENSV